MDHARLAELQGPDSIFSGLTVEDWAEIARRAVQVNFVKGKELLVQGAPGDMMLILTESTARVSMLTSGGRSEARRVGTECVMPWRSRWATCHSKRHIDTRTTRRQIDT